MIWRVRLSNSAWQMLQEYDQERAREYESMKARREAEGRPLSALEQAQNAPRRRDRAELERALTLRQIGIG